MFFACFKKHHVQRRKDLAQIVLEHQIREILKDFRSKVVEGKITFLVYRNSMIPSVRAGNVGEFSDQIDMIELLGKGDSDIEILQQMEEKQCQTLKFKYKSKEYILKMMHSGVTVVLTI